MPIDPKTTKDFERWGKTPPSSQSHGTEDEIRANLTKLQPKNWVLEGNQLKGVTDWGPLVQTIPSNYICVGTDEDGLPKLQKIKL